MLTLIDPVVSLDAEGYFSIKNYLVNELIKNFKNFENVKLVILTHDFQFLFIQLFDIKTNKTIFDKTQVLRLTEHSLREIEIDLLFKDDILLFKELICSIKNRDEIILLPYLNNKIFRHILDIKQREMGLFITKDVSLRSLNLKSEEEIILIDFQNHYYDNFKNKKSSTFEPTEVLQSLKLLRKSSCVLGFQYLVDDAVLNELERIVNEDVKNVPNNSAILEIMKIIGEFLDENKNERVINYINHPRNSFTMNLMTLIMDNTF